MKRTPLIAKLLCVALVASVMMPVGRELYPYIAGMVGTLSFDSVEAVVSAAIGFALYAAMFS